MNQEQSRLIRLCSQDYIKVNVLVEFMSKWRLLDIDSNSTRESAWIPVIFYWLDNYLVIKCIYGYYLIGKKSYVIRIYW